MQSTSRPNGLRLAVAILLAIPGTIFIGQGLGIIQGSSFMVGDPRWAVIGLVMDLVGLAVAWVTLRRRVSGPS